MSTRRGGGGGGGGGGGSVSTGTGGGLSSVATSTPRSSVIMGGNNPHGNNNDAASSIAGYSISGNTAGGASIEYSSAPATHRGGMGGGGMGMGGMDGTPNYHYSNSISNSHGNTIIPPPINMANSQYYESSRIGGGSGNGGGSLLQFCCECYDPKSELLEYDYALDEKNAGNAAAPPQPHPRIRARGEYYIDSYNDQPWSWTFGTAEKNGIWFNSSDQAGSIMSAMVWVLMSYSAVTVTLLTVTEGIPVYLGMMYTVFCSMALACHAKTSLTDPGSVPVSAIPSERQRLTKDSHSMCGQCQTFKPPGSHHCRICNRCISRMDHHCPWMNNCVGAGNLKHFLLFLVYTWTSAAFSLSLFGWNYFFCADEDCTFHPVVLHLVRIMTLLAVGAFLFTSSMLMNVCYGVMTGIGTIDRLKKKATNTMSQSDEEPIALIDIFGIAPWYTWPLPVDPIFDDYDRVVGFTMPQRLDRERQFCEAKRPLPDIRTAQSLELPRCVNDLLPV